jgi:hypothetical protein
MHRKHILRDRYPASPLARWLLPNNGLGTDIQKTCHVIATHCCVTSPLTQRKHCSSILLAAYVLRTLRIYGFTCHNTTTTTTTTTNNNNNNNNLTIFLCAELNSQWQLLQSA